MMSIDTGFRHILLYTKKKSIEYHLYICSNNQNKELKVKYPKNCFKNSHMKQVENAQFLSSAWFIIMLLIYKIFYLSKNYDKSITSITKRRTYAYMTCF